MHPLATPPRPATEAEAFARNESGILCELIDGRIVDKTMSAPGSYLARRLSLFMGNYLAANDLGFLYGPDAQIRFAPGVILEPDVSFTAWGRCPGGAVPTDPIADIVPNLAVEVLSPSNRPGEMPRKLDIYFDGGVELVWLIDPASRSAAVYAAPGAAAALAEGDSLDGGTVLPSFRLPLAQLFARLRR